VPGEARALREVRRLRVDTTAIRAASGKQTALTAGCGHRPEGLAIRLHNTAGALGVHFIGCVPELGDRGSPIGFDAVPALVWGRRGEQRLADFKLVSCGAQGFGNRNSGGTLDE
jgi:hypothetical protein